MEALREGLLTLRNGEPARLAVIGLTDPTGFAEIHQVQAFDWSPHRLVAAQVLSDFATWQQTIPRLDSLADVLIVLSFGGLPEGGGVSRPTSVEEVASWIETHARRCRSALTPPLSKAVVAWLLRPRRARWAKWRCR